MNRVALNDHHYISEDQNQQRMFVDHECVGKVATRADQTDPEFTFEHERLRRSTRRFSNRSQ